MKRIHLLLTTALGAFALTATAQNVPPMVTSQIADFAELYTGPGSSPRSIDLAPFFSDPDVSNAVRMTTVIGTFDIALFGQQKPITVTNFLNYVDQGRYFLIDPTNGQVASNFFHRSVPGFIIQGGGFLGTVNPGTPSDAQPTAVLTFPPIQNEPGISNTRGTIAMAKNGPNSATSHWFINLANNTGLDDPNNPANTGGFTVFGRVVGSGMTVVDAIAAVPVYDFSGGLPNNPYADLPLRGYSQADYNANKPIAVPNLVSIPGIAQTSPLTFSAMSDSPNAGVAVSGSTLFVTGNQVGSAHITVTATDFDGATVPQTFTVNVIAAPGRLVNLSTRMQVGTGDNALIGGFIMQGASSKRLMIRGMGPSSGVPGALANPFLELRDGSGASIASNDNWGDAPNKQEISDNGFAPASPNESVIFMTVPSNTTNAFYTAILTGVNNGIGIGLVEVYDLDSGPGSTLLNISTRGPVAVDPNVLIGGFFVGGTDSKQILVRAIGPTLAGAGIPNPLADPTVELFNDQGMKVDENDDWMVNNPQKTQIQNSGLAPTNAKESAVLQTLSAGPYTAVVRGANGGTGVGSVEVYQL